jgi:hypothetical protein
LLIFRFEQSDRQLGVPSPPNLREEEEGGGERKRKREREKVKDEITSE